jgi:hypothetical protein
MLFGKLRSPARHSVQGNGHQRVVDQEPAIVFDEAELPEFIHEMIHAGARCANHFCQSLLRDLRNLAIGLVSLAIASEQHESAGQTFLARVEELID